MPNFFDKWIIGAGSASTIEYIIHTEHPRFIAKLWDADRDDDDADAIRESPYLAFSLEIPNGDTLYDFVWLDPAIYDEDILRGLGDSACNAIEMHDDKYKDDYGEDD